MTETTNYKLKKPGYEDYVDIDALNGNADIIDTELKNLNDGKAAARHKHTTDDISSGTFPVGRGGTGKETLPSGEALIGNGAGAVSSRPITNLMGTAQSLNPNTNLITANTLRYVINRAESVAAANTSYTTLMARGSSLHNTEASPSVNGAIAWQYE
ncbi:hypothetical protein [Flavonifractor sp. An112]|uniref:hypothetical protein n=1 Tax=Flavonifractor sp. An112 TaxID=1965544 RepID=UPI00174BACFA|nr:hypothetical protein [Flavonifractor sp. An112]HIZ92960.1 hypothetical protein [Candidatus Flavonifractor avicola]